MLLFNLFYDLDDIPTGDLTFFVMNLVKYYEIIIISA